MPIGKAEVRREGTDVTLVTWGNTTELADQAADQIGSEGVSVEIIDLRTTLDVISTPYAIPGSRWIPVEHLDDHLSDIPRDRELVLYCS